jgi:hypothetical protein
MIDYSMLPSHCQEGMKRYIEHGIAPGSFLEAVITNNLVEAFARADFTNRQNIERYVAFLWNECPIGAWGSEKVYQEWVKKGGLCGQEE